MVLLVAEKLQETKLDAVNKRTNCVLLVAKHYFSDEVREVGFELLTHDSEAVLDYAANGLANNVKGHELGEHAVDEGPEFGEHG